MKNKLLLLLALIAILSACQTTDVEQKRKELEAARKELQEKKDAVSKLEEELKKLDPEYAKETDKSVSVTTFKAEPKDFQHKIEVRASVASRKNVSVGSEIGGSILSVNVREGQRVSKGQVLVTLDADVISNNIEELRTSLELATSIYEKQKKLWDQKIGTEIQYLQAKNNKESLERRLATARSQKDQAVVRAPFNGLVDNVQARVGEVAMPGYPLVSITSPEGMYIQGDVSERFIGSFNVGDKVDIYFPVQDTTLESSIAAVSQVINQDNRTFSVEVKLPYNRLTLKPNQIAVLHLKDYENAKAYVISTRLIQVDEKGQYIYQIIDDSGKKIAKKLYVKSGMTYRGETEILEGLNGGELLADRGFRELTDRAPVSIYQDSSKNMAKN